MKNPALRRTLGYWDLVMYGLAYIAPIAPLSTLGFVYDAAHGLIALAYLLGAVCMYFTAQSYALMSDSVPTAGSVYGFARFALGRFVGFVAGWMILLDYLLIPALVYVLIGVALGVLIPSVERSVWIVLMVAFTLGVNWFGVRVTTRANFIAVGFQVIMLLALLGLGVWALLHGKGAGGLTLAPFYDAKAFQLSAVLAATSICINSFLGFDAISTLSEEVKGGDRRLVGRAIMGVLFISATFFVGVAWVLGNLMRGLTIQDASAAAYEMTAVSIGAWASVALAWGYATLIGFSNAMPMQVGVARVLYAMGRDRQLPHVLAKVHPTYHTPYVGMLVTAVISLIVAILMRNRLDDLATTVNFGALSGFLLLHISVLVRFGIIERSRRWFAHWLSPLLGIIVVLGVFSGMAGLAIKLGLAWLVVGLVWGGVLHHLRRNEISAAL